MPKQPTSPPAKWIEIFHSKPSMQHCYLLEKLSNGEFTSPSTLNELVDASHIRDGFRVIRFPARRIEFVLTNGTSRHWEDNNGQNYVIDGIPGRYVVEHGIRRVADSNAAECIQAVMRKNDEFVQVEFRADLWEKCFCSFQLDDKEWTVAPGVQMSLVEGNVQGRVFELQIKGKKIECAFNDGGEVWDSNMGSNYKIGGNGKYVIKDGAVHYAGVAQGDLGKDVDDVSGWGGVDVDVVKAQKVVEVPQ